MVELISFSSGVKLAHCILEVRLDLILKSILDCLHTGILHISGDFLPKGLAFVPLERNLLLLTLSHPHWETSLSISLSFSLAHLLKGFSIPILTVVSSAEGVFAPIVLEQITSTEQTKGRVPRLTQGNLT